MENDDYTNFTVSQTARQTASNNNRKMAIAYAMKHPNPNGKPTVIVTRKLPTNNKDIPNPNSAFTNVAVKSTNKGVKTT